jgi:hypothetical protein
MIVTPGETPDGREPEPATGPHLRPVAGPGGGSRRGSHVALA